MLSIVVFPTDLTPLAQGFVNDKSIENLVQQLTSSISGNICTSEFNFNILPTYKAVVDELIDKVTKSNKLLLWETDGHFSTVYLVALQLGMEQKKAYELAKATEDPDTDIGDNGEYNMDQTWGYPTLQQGIHSLTGGFHGVEEMATALKFLYTQSGDITTLGKLLHRFGDTYAHTKLQNILPEDLQDLELKDASPETLQLVIDSWKSVAGVEIAKRIEPWIQFLNYYVRKYGNQFFNDENLQKQHLLGHTLNGYINYIYSQRTDNFRMYGNEFYTFQHGATDGLFPDQIYIRPDWFITYVKNLTTLLKIKYNLSGSLDLGVFNQMVQYTTENKISMKGIIAYEIKRKLNQPVLEIPIFQRLHDRILLNLDNTDYETIAISAKEWAIAYAFTYYNHLPQFDIKTSKSYLILID